MYTIYYKKTCPYCKLALGYAKQRGLNPRLVEITDIGTSECVRQLKSNGFLKKSNTVSTVPIVFKNGVYIGGSESLK